ncbi:hypothetical protein HK102_008507 [Quaeritorhiza haematococci]|nr:hypothetical protein HK102_008507 [Quaeritorhiza haematococci]
MLDGLGKWFFLVIPEPACEPNGGLKRYRDLSIIDPFAFRDLKEAWDMNRVRGLEEKLDGFLRIVLGLETEATDPPPAEIGIGPAEIGIGPAEIEIGIGRESESSGQLPKKVLIPVKKSQWTWDTGPKTKTWNSFVLIPEYMRKVGLRGGWLKQGVVGLHGNGKGVLNNLMDLTLGHYAGRMDASFLCSKIKEADAPTPTLTKLVGRRFVYISECVDGSKINKQTFKQLCGEDKLTFRPLHGEQVDFHPDFKLFMVCNNLPKFNGTKYSMRRRLRVIPFVSSFKGQDELVGSAGTAKVFLKNPRLNEEIKEWRMSFMHLLLDHYQVYKTETLEPEPATMKAAARTWI